MRRIPLALPVLAVTFVVTAPASARNHQCPPNQVPVHAYGQDLCIPVGGLVCDQLPPDTCS